MVAPTAAARGTGAGKLVAAGGSRWGRQAGRGLVAKGARADMRDAGRRKKDEERMFLIN